MFTCLNNLFTVFKNAVAIKSTVADDIPSYASKLSQVESSFNDLKICAATVAREAESVTISLQQRAELLEKRFNAIADTVDNMIIIKTIRRQWIAINDYTCKFLNIDRVSCLGKSNDQILQLYPHLNGIIDILDNAEKSSWKDMSNTTVKLQLNDVDFTMTIKPIETADKTVGELVLIGKQS